MDVSGEGPGIEKPSAVFNQPAILEKSQFSSVTVHEFIRSSHGVSSATIPRSESFPATHYDDTRSHSRGVVSVLDWAAAPVPKDKPRLELVLGKLISTGRMGLVYEATVKRVVEPTSGRELPLSQFDIPSELCVKVTKPRPYFRTLAREAWMYEQLEEYQGTAVPRCWGFFSTRVQDLGNDLGDVPFIVRPWSKKHLWDSVDDTEIPCSEDDEETTDPESKIENMSSEVHKHLDQDLLPDDPPAVYDESQYVDVDNNSQQSPWNAWHHQPDQPVVSLLILERLGRRYRIGVNYMQHDESEESRADLRDVLQDFIKSSIWHRDLTYRDVLRAPPETTDTCPRHNRKHEWRIIDFDMSLRWDLSVHKDVLRSAEAVYQFVAGKTDVYFVGYQF